MADETTSTSQATLIRTEVLMEGAIRAAQPRLVVMNQLHWDDIQGTGSGTVKYPVESDLGSASGGTEGTDITANTELTMGSAVSVTPTEGAVFRASITEQVVRLRLGGSMGVVEAFQSHDPALLDALLAPDIRRGTNMILNKIETDCIALLDDGSTSVGGGAANDLTITDMFSARYQMIKNQPLRPPSEWKYIITPNQQNEVNLSALVTAGGIGGAVWNQQANYGMANTPDDAGYEAGLFGTFLGTRVFVYDHELRLEAAGAAKGAMLAGGSPMTSPRYPGLAGRVGYGVLVWGAPIKFRYSYDVSLRAMEVVGSCYYLAKELFDLNSVVISSDDA